MSDEGNGPQTVPYEKFAATRRERTEFKQQAEAAAARLADLEGEIAALRKATEGYTSQVEAAQAAAAEHQTAYQRLRAATAVGITDPEVVDAAVWAYGRMATDDRPDFPDALAAWKEKPEEAPVVLRPFLAGAAPNGNGANGRPAPRDPSRPKVHGDPPKYTREKIAELRAAGQWGEHRDAYAAQLAAERRAR